MPPRNKKVIINGITFSCRESAHELERYLMRTHLMDEVIALSKTLYVGESVTILSGLLRDYIDNLSNKQSIIRSIADQVLSLPLKELPLYVNHEDSMYSDAAKWVLREGL